VSIQSLIPEPLLRRLLSWKMEEEFGYTTDMLSFRLKVLDQYGI